MYGGVDFETNGLYSVLISLDKWFRTHCRHGSPNTALLSPISWVQDLAFLQDTSIYDNISISSLEAAAHSFKTIWFQNNLVRTKFQAQWDVNRDVTFFLF